MLCVIKLPNKIRKSPLVSSINTSQVSSLWIIFQSLIYALRQETELFEYHIFLNMDAYTTVLRFPSLAMSSLGWMHKEVSERASWQWDFMNNVDNGRKEHPMLILVLFRKVLLYLWWQSLSNHSVCCISMQTLTYCWWGNYPTWSLHNCIVTTAAMENILKQILDTTLYETGEE